MDITFQNLPRSFELARQRWQSSMVSSDETKQALIREFRQCADVNTNLYLIDMQHRQSVDQFGFQVDVGNFDLRTAAKPDDTLGNHPDKAYSRRDVLPQYRWVSETGRARYDNLKSSLSGVLAHYERIIFPISINPCSPLPTHALALSRPLLIVELGQGDTRNLSPREMMIFNMVASGYTGKEVAKELKASPRTIQTHLEAIKTKMGARNITHAVALYLLRTSVNF